MPVSSFFVIGLYFVLLCSKSALRFLLIPCRQADIPLKGEYTPPRSSSDRGGSFHFVPKISRFIRVDVLCGKVSTLR